MKRQLDSYAVTPPELDPWFAFYVRLLETFAGEMDDWFWADSRQSSAFGPFRDVRYPRKSFRREIGRFCDAGVAHVQSHFSVVNRFIHGVPTVNRASSTTNIAETASPASGMKTDREKLNISSSPRSRAERL